MDDLLIAIDLDGTLLDRRGRISDTNLAAIVQAESAGAVIVPCTGRMWIEAKAVIDRLPTPGVGVFVGGAVVNDAATGQSLDMAAIEPRLAYELVQCLEGLPEAVLVGRESGLCGHDYLVTGQGVLTPATQWWFEASGATVHFQSHVTGDDLHHTLRIAVVTDDTRVTEVGDQLRRAFDGRVLVQHFQAVQTPDPNQRVYVLEVFAAGVDKWRGLDWIAHQRGMGPHQVVAIGDEINDVAMLRSAGCGIAMANAVPEAKAVADHVTLAHDQDGVAHAIRQLLTGQWSVTR